jgi:hypothetical protein
MLPACAIYAIVACIFSFTIAKIQMSTMEVQDTQLNFGEKM